MPARSELGLLQLYTGYGKGKTTAALGLAVRASGHGFRCFILQFMKGRPTGEQQAIEGLSGIQLEQFGTTSWVESGNPTAPQRTEAAKGLQRASDILDKHLADILILDEILTAISCDLLLLSDVIDLLDGRSQPVEIVLTGRDAPEQLIEMADLVSSIQSVKHPFTEGIPARRGIEY